MVSILAPAQHTAAFPALSVEPWSVLTLLSPCSHRSRVPCAHGRAGGASSPGTSFPPGFKRVSAQAHIPEPPQLLRSPGSHWPSSEAPEPQTSDARAGSVGWDGDGGGRTFVTAPQCPCHSTQRGEALDTGFPRVPRSSLPHPPLCWRCLPPKRIPPLPTIRSAAQRGHRRSS